MSRVFYDHLVIIDDIEVEILKHQPDNAARLELMQIVDETLHHHVLMVILDHLPREHHEHFLSRFAQTPSDDTLLNFLKEHAASDIEKIIQGSASKIKQEILQDIANHIKL